MVAPPSSSSSSSPAFTSTLNANAVAFVPSFSMSSWFPPVEHFTDVDAADAFAFVPVHDIPDDELFDAERFLFTSDELHELDQVDEINAMLADLELMETHHELYVEHQTLRKSRAASDADVVDPTHVYASKKPVKHQHDAAKGSHAPRFPKKQPHNATHQPHFHSKKNAFAPIQQPRSIK